MGLGSSREDRKAPLRHILIDIRQCELEPHYYLQTQFVDLLKYLNNARLGEIPNLSDSSGGSDYVTFLAVQAIF